MRSKLNIEWTEVKNKLPDDPAPKSPNGSKEYLVTLKKDDANTVMILRWDKCTIEEKKVYRWMLNMGKCRYEVIAWAELPISFGNQGKFQWIDITNEVPLDPMPESDTGSKSYLVTVRQGDKNKTLGLQWEKAVVHGKTVFCWLWYGYMCPWQVTAWSEFPEPFIHREQ